MPSGVAIVVRVVTTGGSTGTRAPAAIFDLDRTLLPGSSLVYVAKAAVRQGLISPWTVVRGVVEDARFRANGWSDGQVRRLHERLLRMVAGWDVDQLTELVLTAAPHVVADIRPGLRRTVDMHLAAGDVCVVLSASPHELVADVARRLGAHHGFGTRPEIVDGRCTGQLDGEACYGPGKLGRLLEANLRVDLRRSYAYADSASDLPLLHAVGHPVAVNPDRRLRTEAEERAWPVIGVGHRRQTPRRHRVAAA